MSGKIGNNIGYSSGSVTAPSAGVEIRSDDPTLTEGLLWYNSTSNVLKVARNIGAWSAGGTLASTREGIHGNNGTQSACFVSVGSGPSGNLNTTEKYNGSVWGSGNASSEAKNSAMHAGTLTAGLLWGGWTGYVSTRTEEYDGTNFSTSGGTLAQGVKGAGGTGTQTAGLSVGGFDGSSKYASAEEYDGTSWADGGDLAAAQYGTTTVGILTAALTAGGDTGSQLNTAYEYNGTSWTSVTAQSESKKYSNGFGVQTDAVICGGDTGSGEGSVVTTVQIWSGDAWSSGTSMTTAKKTGISAGTGTAGLVAGGHNGSASTNTTLEYDFGLTARSVTSS